MRQPVGRCLPNSVVDCHRVTSPASSITTTTAVTHRRPPPPPLSTTMTTTPCTQPRWVTPPTLPPSRFLNAKSNRTQLPRHWGWRAPTSPTTSARLPTPAYRHITRSLPRHWVWQAPTPAHPLTATSLGSTSASKPKRQQQPPTHLFKQRNTMQTASTGPNAHDQRREEMEEFRRRTATRADEGGPR